MNSYPTFHPGEIAIFMDELNAPPRRWNGHELLILGPLTKYRLPGLDVDDTHLPDGHVCRFPDSAEIFVWVGFLRKKPGQQERAPLGDWELCPWRPAREAQT